MKYFIEGLQAFDAGKFSNENPYKPGSHAFVQWERGWHDAWYEYQFNKSGE